MNIAWRAVRRYAHTMVQFVCVMLIALSIWLLTGLIGWSGLFIGIVVCGWSILSELTKPLKSADNGPNLREVP